MWLLISCDDFHGNCSPLNIVLNVMDSCVMDPWKLPIGHTVRQF